MFLWKNNSNLKVSYCLYCSAREVKQETEVQEKEHLLPQAGSDCYKKKKVLSKLDCVNSGYSLVGNMWEDKFLQWLTIFHFLSTISKHWGLQQQFLAPSPKSQNCSSSHHEAECVTKQVQCRPLSTLWNYVPSCVLPISRLLSFL